MKKTISILLTAVLSIGVLAGCGSKAKDGYESGKLTEVHEAVKTAMGEEYYPNMPLGEAELEQIAGVSKDMYKEAIAEVPMISMNVDTFIGVEAAEGKADAVETALKEYQDYLVNGSLQYPMNVPKVQSAEVIRKGNYVFFVMVGQIPMEILDGEDEQAMVDAAKESNKKAIDAIDGVLK